MGRADLHIHSTASDGLLSPMDIVNWGVKKKLKAIALTDHDTIDGIKSAVAYSMNTNLEVIPGIEISTDYNNAEVHILGYFIDYKDATLISLLNKLKSNRIERAKEMIKKLNRLGYGISYDELKEESIKTSIGRLHVARLMVKYGYCSSTEEVFERFLGNGKPAYVERYKISPFEAVELISKCKGASSIAHPRLIYNIDLPNFISKLKSWGLSGIEVFHSKHSEEDIKYLNDLALKLSLIPTGGTDCHGTLIDNELSLGNVTVSYENVAMLKAKCAAY